MSEKLRNRLFIGTVAVLGSVLLALVLSTPTREDRVEYLGSRIKCPVCQGESIANSPSQMARDMMSLVEERVEAGASNDAIISEILGSYSGAVLLDPPPSGSTLALWLAPVVALIIGGVVIANWRRRTVQQAADPPPTRGRVVAGGIILGAAFAAVIVIAGSSLQERDGPATGVADLGLPDLSEVSNETMEAVIAANLDNPQIDQMRLALAGRYAEGNDYGSAIMHYLAVAESEVATDAQAVTALVQMGRLVWDGNGEAEVAVSLFDRAIAIDPGSWPAHYNRAIVHWCGMNDLETAVQDLASVLALNTPDDIAASAKEDIELIESGEACT